MRAESHNAEETQALGRRLGELAQAGDLYLLHGVLGAGKTTFTQGLAWGAGATGYAHSPTFVLVNEYRGRVNVHHVDLYRIDGDLEAHDLGFEEMLEDGVVVVEWPERAESVFPGEHLSVTLAFGDSADHRVIEIVAIGERYEALIIELREKGELREAAAP